MLNYWQNFNFNLFLKHRKYDYLYFCVVNRDLFKRNNFWKYFSFIFGLYFLGIFSLLIADVYYADDYYRATYAKTDFLGRNRYIAEYGSKLFALSSKLPDYSPISQLIAILFLSLGSILLVKIINGKLSYIGLIASLPLGLSPHFLANLSYKYDSPFMSLALIITILPFIYSARKFVFATTSVVTLLIMLTSYQAASGVYPLIVLFIALSQIIKSPNRQIIKFIAFSASLYIMTLFIYKLCFYPQHTELSIISSPSLLFHHLSSYINILHDDIRDTAYLFLISIVYILWFIYSVYYSNQCKKLILMCVIFYSLLGIFLCFGLLFFFTPLRFDIRTFVGFGLFIALFSVSLVNYSKWKKFNTIVLCLLAWQLLIISNVFANSLQAQYEFVTLRHRLMYTELSQLLPVDNSVQINIFDNYKQSPVLKSSIRYFPAIDRLHSEFVAPGVAYYWNYLALEKVNTNKCNGEILNIFDRKHYTIKKFSNDCFEIYYK